MTVTEALAALREGRLDEPLAIDGDPEATAALRDLAAHLHRVVDEVRRILDEIAVQGRLGGQALVPDAVGAWGHLVVDTNYLSVQVTNQIRDLHQTMVARKQEVSRPASAGAAGEIRALMDAVNEYATSERGGAALAATVSDRADRIQANIDTLEARVEERTEEVRRLLEARTNFFAALSHELRTPLAVILRQSESLLAAPAGDPDSTAYSAGMIHQSADELLAIVNDVLELARAETGHLELDFETIDLLEVLRTLQPTLDGLARTSEVDFTYDVPDDPLPMRADPRRLREVILNLVDNACKYTPPGGEVRVHVRRGTSVVNIIVDDTGVGIAHDQRHQIFEPFYRAPGVETQRGEPSTGLGLALTKRIVQAHDGMIYCIPGERGTRFAAILPVRSNLS